MLQIGAQYRSPPKDSVNLSVAKLPLITHFGTLLKLTRFISYGSDTTRRRNSQSLSVV